MGLIEMQCPICSEIANIQIAREVDFFSLRIIFNFWTYGKIIATCGNCHESFEVKRKEAYGLLDPVGVSANRSNIKKNLLSLSIPLIIIILICIII